MWLRHVLVGLIVLLFGLAVRFVIVETASPRLSVADLHRFENSFDLDLPDWYGDRPFFLNWTRGDGQAFVALAADLDLDGPAAELAVPLYRYSRVGYAWLGRMAALGSVSLVPIGLLVVNSFALVVLGMLASHLAVSRGPYAYLLTVNPALYVGFASDTAETLGVVLLVGALVAASRMGRRSSAAWLAAVRPSMVTALPARGTDVPATMLVFALVAVAVRLIGLLGLGADTSIPPSTIVLPLTGYFDAWESMTAGRAIVAAIPLIAGLVTVGVGIMHKQGWMRLAWIGTGLVALTFGPLVLASPFNWTRAVAAVPTLWAISALRGQNDLDHSDADLDNRLFPREDL